jgi:hypothetical protein
MAIMEDGFSRIGMSDWILTERAFQIDDIVQ